MVELLMGAGNILSGVGQLYAGEVADKVGKYNAAMDLQNAKLEEEQAAVGEDRQRRMSYKALSSIKAGYGAAGVTLEGSPLDVLEESATNAELDALLIRQGGQVRAQRYRASALLSRYEGKAAKYGSRFAAAGSFLKGGASFLG